MQLEIRVLFKVYQAYCLQSKYLEFRVSGWGCCWGVGNNCRLWGMREQPLYSLRIFFFSQTASHPFVLNIHSFQILGCGWLHGVISRPICTPHSGHTGQYLVSPTTSIIISLFLVLHNLNITQWLRVWFWNPTAWIWLLALSLNEYFISKFLGASLPLFSHL